MSIRVLLTQGDERLLALAAEGHERAFEALIHRYRRDLLAYCRRLLLSDDRAEDALQQALLQAWLALEHGCLVRAPRQWLFRIVHNTALNALRVSGYDYTTLSETLRGDDAPEHDLDRRIAVREAFAGLAALPPMQREALLRTAVDGCSHEQAARALGVSENALRGLVYRARASVRAATTALTPSPLLTWALGSRGSGTLPAVARLADLGAGGGSVGIGAALIKGGTIVVAAGALAGGLAPLPHASHRQLRRTHAHALPASASPAVSTTAERSSPASNDSPHVLSPQSGSPTGLTAQRRTSQEHRHTPSAGALQIEPTQPRSRGDDRPLPEDRGTRGSGGQPRVTSSQPGQRTSADVQSPGAEGQSTNGSHSAQLASDPNGNQSESQAPVAETAGSKPQSGSPEQRSHEGSGASDHAGDQDGSGPGGHSGASDDGGGASSSSSSPSPEGSGSRGDCGQASTPGHSNSHSSATSSGGGRSSQD